MLGKSEFDYWFKDGYKMTSDCSEFISKPYLNEFNKDGSFSVRVLCLDRPLDLNDSFDRDVLRGHLISGFEYFARDADVSKGASKAINLGMASGKKDLLYKYFGDDWFSPHKTKYPRYRG